MGEPSPEFLEELSELTRSTKPPDLTPDIFPYDLDVIDFDPNGKFRIRIASLGQRIAHAVFSFMFFVVFASEMFGAVGFFLGILLWAWRSWLGTYISINLTKMTHAVVTPASANWTSSAPDVEIRSSRKGEGWKTTLVIGEMEVIKRISPENCTHHDLENFVNALNSRWGRPVQVKVAEGVYVSPSGSESQSS